MRADTRQCRWGFGQDVDSWRMIAGSGLLMVQNERIPGKKAPTRISACIFNKINPDQG